MDIVTIQGYLEEYKQIINDTYTEILNDEDWKSIDKVKELVQRVKNKITEEKERKKNVAAAEKERKKNDAAAERERNKQEARKEKERKKQEARKEKERKKQVEKAVNDIVKKLQKQEDLEEKERQKEERQKTIEENRIAREQENLREAKRIKEEKEQLQRKIEAERKAKAAEYIKNGVVINTTLGLEDGSDEVEYFTDSLTNDENEIAVCGNKTLRITKEGSAVVVVEQVNNSKSKKYSKTLESIRGFTVNNDRINGTKDNITMLKEPVDPYKDDDNNLSSEKKNMNILWNKNREIKENNSTAKVFYAPGEHQEAVLNAKLDTGVLICHGPGEGKTINAILVAEQKRNELILKKGMKDLKILVVAPQGQILLQWQETVINMGINPSHYIFQTLAHFQRSQGERLYPEYATLQEETKKLYTENLIIKVSEDTFVGGSSEAGVGYTTTSSY